MTPHELSKPPTFILLLTSIWLPGKSKDIVTSLRNTPELVDSNIKMGSALPCKSGTVSGYWFQYRYSCTIQLGTGYADETCASRRRGCRKVS